MLLNTSTAESESEEDVEEDAEEEEEEEYVEVEDPVEESDRDEDKFESFEVLDGFAGLTVLCCAKVLEEIGIDGVTLGAVLRERGVC